MSGRQKVRDSQKRRGEAGSEKVTLRVGTVNVGTLKGRSGEVVDMAGRRKLDICFYKKRDGEEEVRGRWEGRMLGTNCFGVDVIVVRRVWVSW